MTEAEWLRWDDPTPMLEYLRDSGRANERRCRLLACACVRRGAWPFLSEERCRKAVEARERFEYGLASADELKGWQVNAWRALREAVTTKSHAVSAVRAAAEAAGMANPSSVTMRLAVAEDYALWWPDLHRMWAHETERWLERVLELAAKAAVQPGAAAGDPLSQAAWVDVRADQCALLRCLLGNPFRPLQLIALSLLKWRDATVVRLAQAAYQDTSPPDGTLDSTRLAVLADALEEAGCTQADLLDHLRGPGPHVRGCFVLHLLLSRG
jgi:hypothetical protein